MTAPAVPYERGVAANQEEERVGGVARPRQDRIFLALDGSPAAASALPQARAIASALGARLEVLYYPDFPANSTAQPSLPRLRSSESFRLLSGADLIAALGEAVEGSDVRLLVLTSYGWEHDAESALSNATLEVIRSISRPVLVVRPDAHRSNVPHGIERILCPLDGTPRTAGAMAPAAHLACQLGASLAVLYVLPPTLEQPWEPGSVRTPRYMDHAYYDWMRWAEDLCESVDCPPDVAVKAFLACGDITEEIVRFADEREIDLIVLVRASALEAGHGLVIKHVLEKTPCPVLILGASQVQR